VYESEKIRVDQVLEKVSSTSGVGAKSDFYNPLWNLTFSATQASPGACNPLPMFTNLYYTLRFVRCALSN
jgi:hypothetical protein